MKIHFDGWGHKTCDYFQLVYMYRFDSPSLAVLRRFAPYGYVVTPDIEIFIKKGATDQIEVLLIWPGETRRFCKKCDDRSKAALRRLFTSGDTLWRVFRSEDGFYLKRRGRIIENKKMVDYSLSSAEG